MENWPFRSLWPTLSNYTRPGGKSEENSRYFHSNLVHLWG